MAQLIHLGPEEAVAEARRQAAEEPALAVERLDRYLRARLLGFLQSREGRREELGKALVAARAWAAREVESHLSRWSLLLEILEDSRRVPSEVEGVELLTDRASSILARLILASADSSSVRPKTLARDVGISEQNVNNYLRRMEKQGLVLRHRPPGQRAVLVFPTRKAMQLAERLGLSSGGDSEMIASSGESVSLAPENEAAPTIPLWHLSTP